MKTNLQAAAYTEAHRKALDAINQSIRAEGRKPAAIALSDRAKAAAALVANDPKWLEDAAHRIERWFGAKISSGAQKTRR